MAAKVAAPAAVDSQIRDVAIAVAKATLDELRRRPVVLAEWLSQKDAAAYIGVAEVTLSCWVKAEIAPPSVLFSRNMRRFRVSELNRWCSAGGPSQFRSTEGDAHA